MMIRTFATVVSVIPIMKEVIMTDQHIPEAQIILGAWNNLHQSPLPLNNVKVTIRNTAQNALRQKVTSKLGAESRCRVTTPAILRSKVTKMVIQTAWKWDMSLEYHMISINYEKYISY